jgi:tRNA(Ile)-lysidine synthase
MNLSLNHTKKYLLACSFGPDSMALLSLLLKGNYSFSVAHVNYNLREESWEETKGLSEFCHANNIPLFIYEVEEKITSNLEERCREIRYTFFQDLYTRLNIDYLLVGHNQDDNIETYLLQKKRRNLVKYFGIEKETTVSNMSIIRPLLNFKKSFLTDFCLQNRIPFSIDSSNLTNLFQRNIVRHEIVEKLSDEKRNEILKEINDKNIELLALRNKVEVEQAKECIFLLTLKDQELAYALTYLGRKVKPDFEISLRFAKQVRMLLESEKPNIETKVNGLIFIKAYDQCHFALPSSSCDYSFIMETPSLLQTLFFYADFRHDYSNRNINTDDFPLTIRNAHKEDQYIISGYKATLRRLFIDWKMPLELRKRWPVIINKKGVVIYVPRYQPDFVPTKNINFYVK